jgi:hypothetical protein
VWLILPLVYFLAWKQTGSWRQAFNATIAWIIGFSIFAIVILALDMGGYGGVRAMPDSPAAGIAFLGGFIGMWTSNILWRRRGGDPPRKPGRWERTFRAMFGGEQKKRKKSKKQAPAQHPAQQQLPPPPPQHGGYPQPVDAQYRPVAQQPAQSAPQYAQPASEGSFPTQYPSAPPQGQPQQPYPEQNQGQYPQQHVSQQGYAAAPPPQGGYVQQPAFEPAQPAKRKQSSRRSPTADKYAKATGRALGAMFRGSGKKKRPKQQ